jgi:hypothetical protein
MEARLLDVASRILDSIPEDTDLHREVCNRLDGLTDPYAEAEANLAR